MKRPEILVSSVLERVRRGAGQAGAAAAPTLGCPLPLNEQNRNGALKILGFSPNEKFQGILGLKLVMREKIFGFPLTQGENVLIAVDGGSGRPLRSNFPIFSDAAGFFCIRKEFMTRTGRATPVEESLFLPYGALQRLPEGGKPWLFVVCLLDGEDAPLLVSGVEHDHPALFLFERPVGRSSDRPEGASEGALSGLIALLARMAQTDGQLRSEEIRVVRTYFSRLYADDPVLLAGVRDQLKRFVAKPLEWDAIFTLLKMGDEAQRASVFALVVNVAAADGVIEEKEWAVLDFVRTRLGIPEEAFHRLVREYQPQEYTFFQALGLKPPATFGVIRDAYRARCMEYHPDRYQNLPVSFQEFAKVQFQKVQEAYAFLRAKYGGRSPED